LPTEVDMNALSDSVQAPPLPLPILPEHLPDDMEQFKFIADQKKTPLLLPPELPPKAGPDTLLMAAPPRPPKPKNF